MPPRAAPKPETLPVRDRPPMDRDEAAQTVRDLLHYLRTAGPEGIPEEAFNDELMPRAGRGVSGAGGLMGELQRAFASKKGRNVNEFQAYVSYRCSKLTKTEHKEIFRNPREFPKGTSPFGVFMKQVTADYNALKEGDEGRETLRNIWEAHQRTKSRAPNLPDLRLDERRVTDPSPYDRDVVGSRRSPGSRYDPRDRPLTEKEYYRYEYDDDYEHGRIRRFDEDASRSRRDWETKFGSRDDRDAWLGERTPASRRYREDDARHRLDLGPGIAGPGRPLSESRDRQRDDDDPRYEDYMRDRRDDEFGARTVRRAAPRRGGRTARDREPAEPPEPIPPPPVSSAPSRRGGRGRAADTR
eukprot:tig00000492_g1521.t1